MSDNKGLPASFLLRNSKGHPDFVMTMLTIMIIALCTVILFWMMLNLLSLRLSSTKGIVEMISGFNENTRLIVLGICSSVFSLAGAYFLRRKYHDSHYEKLQEIKIKKEGVEFGIPPKGEFVELGSPTLIHPNYDDEEEDI